MSKIRPLPKPRPTIVGVKNDEFDVDGAVETFHTVLNGKMKSKEGHVTRILTSHNNEQRQIIREKYLKMHDKDLATELKRYFRGDFAKTCYNMMLHLHEYLCEQVNGAIAGLGTDDDRLIGLLCCRSNKEMEGMRRFYRQKYGKEMADDVADDLSFEVKTLATTLIGGTREERDDDYLEESTVRRDAKDLYCCRTSDLGGREEIYNTIFTSRSWNHLRDVFETYAAFSGRSVTIEDSIAEIFASDTKNFYLAIVDCARDLPGYNAKRLYKAMKGLGTDDDTLIEIIVSRSEVDLLDICDAYERIHQKTLVKAVSGDTSGDYKNILTSILNKRP